MAPIACPLPASGAPEGLARVTKNCSSPSNTPSASSGTSISFSVSPGANTSVPMAAT
jgi:hypothetical protein